MPQGIGVNRKVAQGTKNILDGAAMSDEEFDLAYQAGYNRVVYYAESGINLFPLAKWVLVIQHFSSCSEWSYKTRPTDNCRSWIWP